VNVGCGSSVVRIGGMLMTLGLLLALAAPVAGGGCSLQATVGGGSATEVPVGEEVLIEGFGFPPGDVDLEYEVGGAVVGTDTASADGSGFFEVMVTPQPGQEGLWTVTATADIKGGCTADTGFLVLGGAASPTPTPAATPSQLPNVAALAPRVGSHVLFVAGVALLLTGSLVAWAVARARRIG